MIRLSLILLCAALTIASAEAAPLFQCAIGKKTVSVTRDGGHFTYQYGAPGKAELTITGDAKSGNVFALEQRFAGMEYQLRFQKGDTSYIVYDSEGNGNSGASASSGLVVMQGGKTISDRPCKPFAEFGEAVDGLGLPEDSDKYSAL